MDAQGNLYGTAVAGGTNGTGAIFNFVTPEFSKEGPVPTTIYSFLAGGSGDGSDPRSALLFNPNLQNAGGLIVMYGTTSGGGTGGVGTAYEFAIVPAGVTYATATSVVSSPNPAATDGTVQFTASVVPSQEGLAVGDGSVSFYVGNTLLGTVPVVGGTATLSIPASTIAVADVTFTINAQYTPSATSIFTASSGQGSVTLTEPGVATTNGSNTFNGNQTVNGTVTATAFSGDGSKLSNVTASALSSTATVAGSQVTGAISGSQITGSVANATNAVNAMNLTGSIFDTQVTNLAADLMGASTAAVNTTEAYTNKTFLPLAGGTLTGSLNGTSANFNSVQIGGGTPISEYISVTDNVGPLGALNAGTCTTLTTPALTGFTPGTSDTIALGVPSPLTNLGSGIFLIYQAWETSTGPSPTITIQICNASAARYKGGASGIIRIDVFKH